MLDETMLQEVLTQITAGHSEDNLLGAVRTPTENPRIEFRDGQFLLRLTTPAGALVERFLSNAAVRESFSLIPIDSGWLRPEVARWGDGRHGEWAVAFFPPAAHELEITQESQCALCAKGFPKHESGVHYGTQSLGMIPDAPCEPVMDLQRLHVPLPGLVLFGMGTNYFIWAVKTEKLDPFLEIYRAPLPNVYTDGKICWGMVKPPRATSRSLFQAWELFTKSTFNNHLASGKSKRAHDDVRAVLREAKLITTDGSDRYPLQDLVRQVANVGVTLDKALRVYMETGEMPE